MYLQKLEIQGFKSFANKTSLEFVPGITSIVGPNGSGKSNVADSVRWVLGEQSLKSLRGKKSQDVIFAGSDKKTRLGFCYVNMYLNNEDHTAPIDYSEIVITRKMYRDGEGEYYINKNKVRLQDILMLLAKSNFGQRSYSIIGQGMIDLFLAATPTARKEYFDEAAGVRQFQIKKEQAEHKLEQTKENIRQAELLVQEIEPRLRSLTRQVHRLERREEVLKELKNIQHTYYSGLWHELEKKHGQEEERYHATASKQKNTGNELNAFQKKMQQLALGSSRQELFVNLQKQYAELQNEKNKLLREQVVLKGKLQIDHEKRGDLDLVWLERRQEQLDHEIKSTKEALAINQQSQKKSDEQLRQQEMKNTSLNNEYASLIKDLTGMKQQLTMKKPLIIPEIAQELNGIYEQQKQLLEKIEAAATPEDLQGIKAEARALTTRLAQLHHKLKGADAGDPHEIIHLQDRISTLLTTKDDLSVLLADIRIKCQIEKERAAVATKRLSELTGEFEKISRELDHATAKKAPHEIAADLATEEKSITEKIRQLDDQLTSINEKLSGFNQEEQAKKEEVFSLQNEFSKKQQEANDITAELNTIKIELTRIETRKEDLEKEMIDELTDEERDQVYRADKPGPAHPELYAEIQKLKKNLDLIGGIDPQVQKEYQETKERYDFLTNQSEDLNKAIGDLEQGIANLEETIKKQFDKAFEQINKHFTQYFKILFNGGNASLSLVKEEIKDEEESEDEEADDDGDENEESTVAEKIEPKPAFTGKKEKVVTGIDIHATPPGKKLRGISMLSGGERALTSIALICAIIHNNPSPFVILDEVDAALDESNSIRFASIIERLSKKTQFVVITHNRATMNKANILYGVTMGDDGVSRLLSINMAEAENVINDK
jgi:chromosome segregation protein